MLTTFHQLFLTFYLPYIHLLLHTQPLHNVCNVQNLLQFSLLQSYFLHQLLLNSKQSNKSAFRFVTLVISFLLEIYRRKHQLVVAICPEYVDLILENQHLPYLVDKQDA